MRFINLTRRTEIGANSYFLELEGRKLVVDAGLTQLIYLVLFSYAFFFEGFTGLAVTIGAILTLFVVMQMTGRLKWEEKFGMAVARNGRVLK